MIIPQTMPTVIPATGNQVIGMLKETSLVSVLGVADLLKSAQLIYARTYQTIPLLIVASLWYLIMTLVLSIPQSMIEKTLLHSTGPRSRVPPPRPAPRPHPFPLTRESRLDERRRNRRRTQAAQVLRRPGRARQHRPGRRVPARSCCIIGPSGSGKSTLLRCIDGLEKVDRGVLKVNGEDLGYVENDGAYRALDRKQLASSAPGSAWSSSSSTSSPT